ncbi:DUF1648 domain-containing protein [Cytobacillus gottheilii]|uniref:DUF1648 domain-containing protein n=1 Tax=Cytobacillus gottheilii TaxID=859144 RepID=UPI0009BB3F6E|nr:DUF1648 domain-containing protein [Cytobacillus gottheilii]
MFNTGKRPKIKLPKTKSEWFWDIIGYTVFLGSIIFLIYHWKDIPDRVPAHYNAVGEVDRWGSKMELLILPAIGVFMGVMMQVLEKFPEVHNYPERLNENNAKAFYLVSRKLLNQIKNICLMIFAFILFESASIALEKRDGFGVWFLPVVLVSTMIPIVIGFVKQSKIK